MSTSQSGVDGAAVEPGGVLYRMAVLAIMAPLLGTIVALLALGFVDSIGWLNERLLVSLHARAQVGDTQWLAFATVLVPTLGGLLVGLLIQHGSRAGRPLGPPDLIAAVQLHRPLPASRAGVVSSVAAALSIGCGTSVGQYGPLVYIGGLIGQWVTNLKLRIPNLQAVAIACGVAAAISTAFNAPIAGLVFAHEVILRHYSLQAFG